MERLKLMFVNHWKRISAFALVLGLIACSVTFAAKAFTDPQTYRETIQSIDDKKMMVLGVSAGIAGASTLLAAIPGDSTDSVSKELMDLSGYLLIVICALVLEKSLLTVFGAAACYVLFPLAGLFALTFIVRKKERFMSWAIKLAVLAAAFLVIVPASMRLGDYIVEANGVSFEQETEVVKETSEAESEEQSPWYEELWNGITNTVEEAADAAVEECKKLLNGFIDQVSVFVIAYCVIPVFVVFLFLWLLKRLFGLDIKVNHKALDPKRLRGQRMKKVKEKVLVE